MHHQQSVQFESAPESALSSHQPESVSQSCLELPRHHHPRIDYLHHSRAAVKRIQDRLETNHSHLTGKVPGRVE